METFFIGDLHFGDVDCIVYDNRPFSGIRDMHQKLVKNWNSVVSKEDTVFVVGDFILDIDEFSVLNELNGNIVLIVGNHDVEFLQEYEKYPNVKVIPFGILFSKYWIVTHEPSYVSENSPYANIFAHVHTNPMYKTVSTRSFCVSVDRINYTPINFKEIVRRVLAESDAKFNEQLR